MDQYGVKRVGELREEIEILEGQGVLGLPKIPTLYHDDDPVTQTMFEELGSDYRVCAHCGMSKNSHREEKVPVAGSIRIDTLLWCKDHVRDAT